MWPHERFLGKSGRGLYGDFVLQVDDTVGTILNALDRLDVADETIVLFTSDNGSFMFRRNDPDAKDHLDDEKIQAYRADRHRSNHVFRGTKADIWEGGHRVPFFVRWPGVVGVGSKQDSPITHTDVYSTLCAALDIKIADGMAEDSFSFLAGLTNSEVAVSRPPIVHHSVAGMFAIRDGDWKLIVGNGSGGREAPKGKSFREPFQLFNLGADVEEQNDLIEQHPHRAQNMLNSLNEIRNGIYE